MARDREEGVNGRDVCAADKLGKMCGTHDGIDEGRRGDVEGAGQARVTVGVIVCDKLGGAEADVPDYWDEAERWDEHLPKVFPRFVDCLGGTFLK